MSYQIDYGDSCQAPILSSASTSTTPTPTPATVSTSTAVSSASLSSHVPAFTVAPLPSLPPGHHAEQSSPPYLPQTAILGEIPSKSVDIPITTVFLILFIAGAASNMIIFRRNKAKGHLFVPSLLLYVFCMARVVSCIMRIAWSCYPENARLSIAAFIFVSAGVLIMFVANITFAQRMLRASQPGLGWNPGFAKFLKVLYILTVMLLIIAVVAIVHSHYTSDRDKLATDLALELAAMTYFMFLAALPIILIYLAHVIPRTKTIEHFGAGRWKTKVRVLIAGSLLCLFGAAFRTGSQFLHPRRPDDPAWYHSKACFYIFNFTIEVLVVYLYLITRVDQRFHVPNGSRKYGDYSAHKTPYGASSETEHSQNRSSSFSSYARIFDGSSSIYSWGDEKDVDEKCHSPDTWSQFSDDKIEDKYASSESTLQLPPAVRHTRMRVVPMNQSPYVDIGFIHEEHDGQDYWFELPPPVLIRSFGL